MASVLGAPLSRRVRGLGLTRRGWWFASVGAVTLLVAYLAGLEALVFVGCLLLALPLFAIVVVWLRRPRVEVARRFSPTVIPAGSATTVTLTVTNRAPGRSVSAQWWDVVPWPPHSTAPRALAPLAPRAPRFAGQNRATITYDLVPPHRGVFDIGPLGVLVTDGVGLATSVAMVGEPEPIVVTPDVVPLAPTPLAAAVGDGEATLVQRRATGDEDDIMTREYRSGDAMRRVHWRASARHGDLMVRQEEQRSLPEARIIIDTLRAGYPDASTESLDLDQESAAFEWVVRMLASAAVHLRREGFRVSIEETGHPQLAELGHGRRRTWGDEEFLGHLATLELTDDAGAAAARTGSGPLIALVATPTAETVEWLMGQRRPGELAVMFSATTLTSIDIIDRSFGVMPQASRIAHRFVDEGWLVVPVRPDDDPAAAWDAVVVEMGRARGPA